MGLYESWIKRAIRAGHERSLRAGAFEFFYRPYIKSLQTLSDGLLEPIGDPIYELDWDVLIILDACRGDLMRELLTSTEYSYVRTRDSSTSVASMTPDWMERNFVPRYASEMEDTVYVCGNPFSEQKLDADWFRELIEVWRYGWDDGTGTQPPRPVTDEAIRQGRAMDDGRLIVHYMQPHSPFLTDSPMEEGKSLDSWPVTPDGDVWTQLSYGELDANEVWTNYRENLELVMDELTLLLENLDADHAVVSSDHGNAIGEYGIYGHPGSMPFPFLREVPWIEVETTDSGTYCPDSRPDAVTDTDTRSRLESLGYVA